MSKVESQLVNHNLYEFMIDPDVFFYMSLKLYEIVECWNLQHQVFINPVSTKH